MTKATSEVFKYNTKIPEIIPVIFKSELNLTVKKITQVKGGEANFSFKVQTSKKKFIIRISRYRGLPNENKLQLVEKILSFLKINHAKSIYFDNTAKYFPNNFSISEWIDGLNGIHAVEKGITSKYDLMVETGKVLRKIHDSFSFEAFGEPPFKGPHEGYRTFAQLQTTFNQQKVEALKTDTRIPAGLLDKALALLNHLVNSIDFEVIPVLTHNDMSPDNLILSDKGIVIIDWDNALANTFVAELALQGLHGHENTAYKGLVSGYGRIPLKHHQYDLLEAIIRIRLAVAHLMYYAFSKRSTTDLIKVRTTLENLVINYQKF